MIAYNLFVAKGGAMKKRRRLSAYWGISAVILGLVCCRGGRNAWKGSIVSENGVTVVRNPSIPIYSQGAVEFLDDFVIQGSEDNPKFVFVRPVSIVLDRSKAIYVLDVRDNNVKVFDEKGGYARTIGRPGVGPGELESPAYMDIDKNEVAVYCSQLVQMTYYDLSGKFLRTTHSKNNLSGPFKFDSHGDLFDFVFAQANGRRAYQLTKIDAQLQPIKILASVDWVPPQYFQAGHFFVRTVNDQIALGRSERYQIDVFDDAGNLLRKIRRDQNAEKIPKEERDAVSSARGMQGMFDKMPEYYAPYYMLYSDEQGRIIVHTRYQLTGKKEWTYDVFSPEGKFFATFRLKPAKFLWWANQRLYTIEENEEGFPMIRVRRVIWKAGL
jgi:hypothetical protein